MTTASKISDDRSRWDERFRAGDHAQADPDPFLLRISEYRELLPPRPRALDIACGAGRNAVWMAAEGWDVTACDLSLEGLRKARDLAAERGVRVDLFCTDLETPALPRERFDIVTGFLYLDRNLFPALKAALVPGGIIVYKTCTVDQQRFPGRPKHETYFLRHQELLHEFADFRVLVYEEAIDGRGVAQMIAAKTN